jgi:hypothetical protein
VVLDFSPFWSGGRQMLLDGVLVTLQLAAAATILGFLIGTLRAVGPAGCRPGSNTGGPTWWPGAANGDPNLWH